MITVGLLWVLRVLVILLVLRLVLRAIYRYRLQTTRRHPGSVRRETVGGELVRDPHCGTYLPKSRALSVRSIRGVQYFCSPACRDKYAKAHQ